MTSIVNIGALLISLIALGISFWAVYETRSGRKLELRMAVRSRYDATNGLLANLPAKCVETKSGWQAMFAASGMYQSGRREMYDKEFDGMSGEVKELASKLDRLPSEFAGTSVKDLEEINTSIGQIKLKGESIAARLEEMSEEYKQHLAEHRQRSSNI